MRVMKLSGCRRPTRALIALLVVAFAVVLAGPVSSAAAVNKSWTVMVYGDGDNNLESYLCPDIDTEFSGPGSGSDANVNVLFLGDRITGYDTADGDWTGTKLFYCTAGMTATPANALADWGERDMGDPQTLVDLISYGKANYPADKYLVIFWDHGYTWWPGWFMWDDTSSDGITLTELASALDTVGGIDVAAFDCCACSAAEMAATLRPYVQYLVGSEDLTMAEGVAWETVIPALRAAPTMTASTLATTIGTNMNDGTTSAIALDARWDAVVTATDQLGAAMKAGLPANQAAYDAAFKVTRKFAADSTLADLWDLANQVKLQVTDPTIQNACQAVMNAVSACVVYESHKAKFAGAKGITIYWPKTAADLAATDYGGVDGWEYYLGLPWSAQTSWESFLGVYVYQDYTAPATTDNHDALAHHSFTLVLTPTDASSGVSYTEYRVDGGAWKRGTRVVLGIAVRHKKGGYSRGSHLVEYRSVDNAGNVESIKSCTVRLGS
jgi:hypothetical protein